MRLHITRRLAAAMLILSWLPSANAADPISPSAAGSPDGRRASPAVPEAATGVRLPMASAFPGGLQQMGTLGVGLSETVSRLSGGRLQLAFHEPNALVPTPELFDALAAGTLDAAWSTPGYWFHKEPALALFSGVPFGPSAGEFAAWIYRGGGETLMQEIYSRHGIHSMICGLTVPEAAGWFRTEISSVDDLRGLKMRIRGLGAAVMARLGVVPQAIEGGNIYEALMRGTIDAAEYSTPAIDLGLGLHHVAKHYYFPGWHQQSTLFDLMLSKHRWATLDETQKTQLEVACGDNFRKGLAQGEATQSKALNELRAQGVKTHRWPQPILQALEAEWEAIAAELSDQDRNFSKVYGSLTRFRQDFAVWRELGYLN